MFGDLQIARNSDAGNYQLPQELRVLPCFPQNIRELCQNVAESVHNNRPICVSAALTGLAGAAVPLYPEQGDITRIFISKLREVPLRDNFTQLIPGITLSSDKRSVRVAPGIRIEEIIEVLAKQGLMYLPNPEYTKSMVGGNVATNASGPKSFGIGPTRDHVLGLNILLADGEILEIKRGQIFAEDRSFEFKTPNLNPRQFKFNIPSYTSPSFKNAAGLFVRDNMDLIDLFIGSEGILGITTEIELRVFPLRPLETRTFLFSDEQVALDLVDQLRKLKLDRVRFYADPKTSSDLGLMSLEYFDIDAVSIAAARGFPETGGYQAAIQLQFFNDDIGTLERIEQQIEPLKQFIGLEISSELGSRFRTSVPGFVADKLKEIGLTKIATDFSLPVEKFRELYALYAQCRAEFSNHWPATDPLPGSAIWGHIGDCNLHLNLFPRNARANDFAKQWYSRLVEFVVNSGGTITAEHGAGKKKVLAFGEEKHYLQHMLGVNGIAEIRAVKSAFDPKMLLNPGNMGVY